MTEMMTPPPEYLVAEALRKASPPDPRPRRSYFPLVLNSSVSLPVLAISMRENDEARASALAEARADAATRDPTDWSEVEQRLFSPETLDS